MNLRSHPLRKSRNKEGCLGRGRPDRDSSTRTGDCDCDDNQNRVKVITKAGHVYHYAPWQAFVWENGTTTMLEGLGGECYALGINEQGCIVGAALAPDGIYYPVVWTPVPEPCSFFPLLCGSICLARVVRRRAIRP